MKTSKEVKRQIAGLLKMKAKTPKRNFFGSDNHAEIDAQIAVLKRERTSDSFYIEGDDENLVWSAAEQANEWKQGRRKDDLFE